MNPRKRAFDVDLKALLRVFGGHLYSTPNVFVRELVQNGLDAIAIRRRDDARASADELRVRVIGDEPGGRVVFEDNGVGLDQNDLVEHLSRVGSSTKRAAETPGLIGQFGIGLLSGFLVADRITVDTRKPGDAPLRWEADADGAYEISPSDQVAIGTRVTLALRPEMRSYCRHDVLRRLLEEYAAFVDTPIYVARVDGSGEARVNRTPPWRLEFSTRAPPPALAAETAEELLAARSFELDAGAAVLWIRQQASGLSTPRCAVYHHGILVARASQDVLPRWARFVGGVIETRALAPTASRESFVRDDAWRDMITRVRGELIGWLAGIASEQDELLTRLLVHHHEPLMAACLDDEALMLAFADHLPFDTNAGLRALGELAAACDVIRYTTRRSDFTRIAPMSSARGELLVDACHVHEAELLTAWARAAPGRRIEALGLDALTDMSEEAPEHELRFAELLAAANRLLASYQIEVIVRRFAPGEVPALLLADGADLPARARALEDDGSPLQRALIRGLALARRRVLTPMLLNVDNPLISALPELTPPETGARVVRMLYLQAAAQARKLPSLLEARRFSEDLLTLLRELAGERDGRVLN